MSRLYFQKPDGWQELYVYARQNFAVRSYANNIYPGVLLKYQDSGLYYYDIDGYSYYSLFQFNNGVSPAITTDVNGQSVYTCEKYFNVTVSKSPSFLGGTVTPYLGDGDFMFDGSTVTPYIATVTTTSVTVDNSNVVQAINTNNSLLYCFIIMFFVVLAWYFFYKVIKIFV